MLFLEVLIFIFYAFWLVLSIIAQGQNHFNSSVKARDFLNLIPNYRFFCPKPIQHDFHAYYRHQEKDGKFNEWKKVELGSKNYLICFLWNPEKFSRKTFYTIVTALMNCPDRKYVHLNRYYRLLLNHINSYSVKSEHRFTQFKIMRNQGLNSGYQDEELFVSILHKVY
jgi:hypothetical protein